MDELKSLPTFNEYLESKKIDETLTENDIRLILESANVQLTEEQEKRIDDVVEKFISSNMTIQEFNDELTNEGIIGSILGGLTGFALGKSVGRVVARVLGIEKGVLYDLLTSRLVGAALGSSLGSKI